ncbi:MAG: MORN repeat-containing protein, partial [Alphaproteobacteria bacterium]
MARNVGLALGALVGASLLSAAHAQQDAPPPGWIADEKGCRVADPSPEPRPNAKLSFVWSGSCEGGLVEGEGELQWYLDGRPSDRYVGSYREGKRNGHGVYVATGGTRYDGEYKDDKPDGHGVYISANGDRYEGEFKDGQASGHAIVDFANGNRYEGVYRDGKPNGRGVYVNARGS